MRQSAFVIAGILVATVIVCVVSIAVYIRRGPVLLPEPSRESELVQIAGPPQLTKSARTASQPLLPNGSDSSDLGRPDLILSRPNVPQSASAPVEIISILTQDTPVASALLMESLSQQTVNQVILALANIFPVLTIPAGSQLSFLLQPGDTPQLLRLVIAAPNGLTVVTVALTDRGSYVMALPPGSTSSSGSALDVTQI